MKTLKTILALAIITVSITSCTKQDLNDDEVQLSNADIIYATGGEDDNMENGGPN